MIFNTVLTVSVLTSIALACPEANINSITPCKSVIKIDTVTKTVVKIDTLSKDTIIFNRVYKTDTISTKVLVDITETFSESPLYESLGKLVGNIQYGFLKGYKETSIQFRKKKHDSN